MPAFQRQHRLNMIATVGVFILISLHAAAQPADSSAVKPVTMINDYQKLPAGDAKPAVSHWQWSDQQKTDAVKYSSLQIVTDPETRKNALKIRIAKTLPFGRRAMHRAASLSTSYLPPAVDALRLRIKPLRGSLLLSVGGPTIYFGHSDVYSRPVKIKANGKGWRDLIIPLNHSLVRNFRRANFGAISPAIYYTRWIQEPISLSVWKGSDGEMLIQSIEGVSLGQGKPFPVFPAEKVKHIAAAADLKNPQTPFALNIGHSRMLTDIPEKVSPGSRYHVRIPVSGRLRPWHVPPTWTVKDGVLDVSQDAAEEVSLIGMKLNGKPAKNTNAIRITLEANNSESRPTPLVLDFLLLAAKTGETFPWKRFELAEKIRKHHPALNYNYIISLKNGKDADIAMFHARRTVKRGKKTELIIPLDDFVCFFGRGPMKKTLLKQKSPTPEQMAAIALLTPYQHRTGKTTFRISGVDFVSVPAANPKDLRSYRQLPDATQTKITPYKGQFVQEVSK